jgi:hypothetical protein
MDFLELIFALVRQFVPVDEAELRKMYGDAQKWKLGLNPESENKIEALYCKYAHQWYIKLALAVLYIPLVRWIMDYMSPRNDEEKSTII